MMNETGNYPGQPWMWLYTFWCHVKPFSTPANALVRALMMALTVALMFLPLIRVRHPSLGAGAQVDRARLLQPGGITGAALTGAGRAPDEHERDCNKRDRCGLASVIGRGTTCSGGRAPRREQ